MVFAASTQRTIGIVLAVILLLGWVVYLFSNFRRARPEVGSEIELAANRRPYYDDEVLEGRKLDRSLLAGVATLVVIGIGLPLYWLNEPTRQAEATTGFDKRFARWGSELYEEFGCVGCHGADGVGGAAAYTITDPRTGRVESVSWRAPALNSVMQRFDEEEVRYILVYGRPFSPMSPWGVEGGGPMNEQQINNLIEYLKSIQISPEQMQEEIAKALGEAMATGDFASEGEALFNLEVASGAYSCARCHTRGWSYDRPEVSGGGALGPNLTGGATVRQFPLADEHEQFINEGSENGKRYGQQGQGSGRMPGFGQMLTEEQIAAIVEYERSL